MPVKACRHGKITITGKCRLCKAEDNTRQYLVRKARGQRTGSTPGHRRARREALEAADNQCEFVEAGERCQVASKLEYHHRNGDPLDNRPGNRQMLCHGHHLIAQSILRRQQREDAEDLQARLARTRGAHIVR
jgi:hypothetical protein